MRPAWLLAIRNASERRNRALLLTGAVALSAALIVAVVTAMHSLNTSVELRTSATIGAADVRIEPRGTGQAMDARVLDQAREWEGVELAAGRLEVALSTLGVRKPVYERDEDGRSVLRERTFTTSALANGIDLELEDRIRPMRLLRGRMPKETGEVVIDALLAYRLGWSHQSRTDAVFAFEMVDPRFLRLRDSVPSDPGPDASARRIERFNERQGVRVGDELTVVRSLLLGGDVRAAAWRAMAEIGRMRALGSASFLSDALLIGGTLADGVYRLTAYERSLTLRVVGIAEQPPLGGRPQLFMDLGDLQRLTGREGRLSSIDLVLDPEADAEALSQVWNELVPDTLLVQTTARITSSLDKNLKSSQLGFLIASLLAFLSASFIVMTGLTTDIAERQRELAVIRCIGSNRLQLAEAQLVLGGLIGIGGALVGVPLGISMAWGIALLFPSAIPSGLIVPWVGVGLAAIGSIGSGLAGALIPAWNAARLSPLKAMGVRSRPVRAKGVAIVSAVGLVGIGLHLALILAPIDKQLVFWLYALVGLPAMFVGYFMLSVPLTLLVIASLGRGLSAVFRLPPSLLVRSVAGTPYRYGFTAGAMMTGLALMVSIWSNGGAVLRDWLGRMEFPDAFVSGPDLNPLAQETLDALPHVTNTCRITLEIVDLDPEAGFGVRALQDYKTTFIGFEPDRFFEMTRLQWVQGSVETALPRLLEGGTVIVAREFLVASGLGVGKTFRCFDREGNLHEFEIVGVVTSPGLDIASRFFNIGETYTHQAVHAVFASIDDMRERFGSDRTHLIQVNLSRDYTDDEALAAIREAMAGFGVLDVGSGRQIKEGIRTFATGTLLVFSVIAVAAMVVACFGVANLIVAAIEGRRFEFGVLRSVGGSRGMLVRLVLSEATLIAIVASIVGTMMGLQSALGGRRIYELMLGIEFSVRPPVVAILLGCLAVLVLTLAAAGPAAWRLNRQGPRELLASTRG